MRALWKPLHPPHLSELLSRYMPDSGVHRLDAKCVEPQGLCLWRGRDQGQELLGVGVTSLLFGRRWLPSKMPCKGDRLAECF